jgi:hypothetical protein
VIRSESKRRQLVKRILILLVFLGLLTCLCLAGGAVGFRALAATSEAELPDDGPQIATSAEAGFRLVEKVTESLENFEEEISSWSIF